MKKAEARGFAFVARPQLGGRRPLTENHPIVWALLETARSGKAVVLKGVPNISVRKWLRSHGFFVRTRMETSSSAGASRSPRAGMIPTVSDDPVRGRLYTWPDGIELPSVTTIITKGLGLHYDSPEAAARGTAIHEACALLDGGGDGSGLDWSSMPEEWHGYLHAWERAKKWMKAEIVHIEFPVWSMRLGYAGRLDRVMVGNGSTVVDIKSGAKESWHTLQTAAYAGALRETLRTSTWFHRATVYLQANGVPKIEDRVSADLHSDLRVFLALQQVYLWRVAKGG